MPALARSPHSAIVTWLGVVRDRGTSLCAVPVDRAVAGIEGFVGESHSGATRPACSRFTMLYPKGTEVRNTRQLSILSGEDLVQIAAALDLDSLDPGLLGASMVVEGMPDFSHLTPGARLKAPSGAVITVDLENGPCVHPAREIEARHPGHGKAFPAAAEGRRGVTAWVERPGAVAVGDRLEVFLPTQPAWQGTTLQAAAE